MKIGIDIRTFSIKQKDFVVEFIKLLKENKDENIYNIYGNDLIEINHEKINIINNKKFNSLFGEQVLFLKKLIKDENDLIITFEDSFPVFYKRDFIKIIPSLEKVFYPELLSQRLFYKQITNYIYKNNFKKSKKIITPHKKTLQEINDKLNINESKIEVIPYFFYKIKSGDSLTNIKDKYEIKNDFIIYNSGVGNAKNIKKFLESFSEIQKSKDISLVILGNEASNDIEFREMTLDLKLGSKIKFIGEVNNKDLKLFYKEAILVIHPVIYENFPFSLNEAISFNTKIISSELDEIKDIFGNKINYFNPRYKNDIKKVLLENLDNTEKNINYEKILKDFNGENFLNNLIKTI